MAKPFAFFGQKAGVLAVAAPVFEIDFLVRDIPVAAHHDFAPARLEFFQVRVEFFHEAEFGLLTLLTTRTRRQVDRDYREFAGSCVEVSAHVAPFGIELGHAESGGDLGRFLPAVEADAAIALLFGVVEMAVITGRGQHLGGHVGVLRLDFLHAQHIGLVLCQPRQETLAFGRADAVEIERDDT